MSRKGKNIYKRKDGRWEARFFNGVDSSGRKKYASVYGNTYTEAKEKQIERIKSRSLINSTTTATTLSALMNEWLNNIESSVKKSTYQKYSSIIRNHIDNDTIGNELIETLTSRAFSEFAKSKLQSNKLTTKTINDILTIMSSALSYAQEAYNIKKPRIKRVKEEIKEMRVLSIEEQIRLEQYLYSDMTIYKFGVLIALYTGIRIGELCALTWDDMRDDYIIISKTLYRISEGNHTVIKITEPKTRTSNRIIPIPGFLQSVINQHRSSSGPVLKNRNGKPIEPRLMQQQFEKIIKDCGIRKTNFHALRHTFATRCIEAGFEIKTLSEVLGHSDVKTTLNKYVHSSYELKQKNMELLQPAITL